MNVDKIAIISDIHGNIPALVSVLEDIEARKVTRIFCLGDIIGKGPFPEIAVDIIRKKCEKVVKGNWDKFISEDNSFNAQVGIWNRNKLGKERLEYLNELPLYIEFFISGKLMRLFHAAAEDVFKRVYGNAAVEDKIILFKPPSNCSKETLMDSDIVGYGDIHNAYVQNFAGKTIFNVGSVGNPLDITQASYAIIEGEYNSRSNTSVSINLIRVPYDIEKAVEEARQEKMPELEEYINELRSGKYRGIK
jgi:Predicted phosphoesterase